MMAKNPSDLLAAGIREDGGGAHGANLSGVSDDSKQRKTRQPFGLPGLGDVFAKLGLCLLPEN